MGRSYRRLMVAIGVTVAAAAGSLPATAAPSGGALPPGATLVLDIAGSWGVPLDAVGVAVNVTVTEPTGAGFLTVYPCGERPATSNLNYVAGQTVPNFVVSALDAAGQLCIDTMTVTDVVVDLAGYLPAGSEIVTLPAPQRFLDTRIGIGAPIGQVPGLSVLPVHLAGTLGIPVDAAGAIVNATVVDPIAEGYLTVAPCDGPGGIASGGTSTLNYAAHEIVPNLTIGALGPDGNLCFFTTAHADLVADVAGYLPAGAAGIVTLDAPARVADTRFGQGGPAVPLDASTRWFDLVDAGGRRVVPADATAAIVNLTATRSSAAGFVTAFPCGQPPPFVSNLNFAAGETIANMAVVQLGPGAQLCLRAMVPVDVIIDVMGYTSGAAALVPVPPVRVYDSRVPTPDCGITVRWNEPRFEWVGGPAVVALPNQPVYTSTPIAYVGPTCVLYLVGSTADGDRVDVYDREGRHLRQFEPPRRVPIHEMSATSSGLIGITHTAEPGALLGFVIDVETGAVKWPLPMSGIGKPATGLLLWGWVGATADESIIALRTDIWWSVPYGTRTAVLYFDRGGNRLFNTVLPYDPGIEPVALSPNGRYLAYRDGGEEIGPFTLHVATLDGAVVASLPDGADPTWFMSDGSLAVCVRPFGTGTPTTQRWDLFTASTPLTDPQWSNGCQIVAAG